MNAKERYDAIISSVETCIRERNELKPGKVADIVCQKAGYSPRELGNIFNFLTGRPLINYIRDRQMMHAYRSIIESDSFNWETAISFTGHGDQAAFNKAFKRMFEMTPTDAFAKKDRSQLQPPQVWDTLAASEPLAHVKKDKVEEKTTFGIKQEQYERIMEMLDLQALYGFNQMQSEVAFELAEKNNISLKDAFEFLDDFCIQHYSDDDGVITIPDQGIFKSQISAYKSILRLCARFNLSIDEATQLEYEFTSVGVPLTKGNDYLVTLYLKHQYDISTFFEMVDFFEDNARKTDNLDEFLDEAFVVGPEAALEIIHTDWNSLLDNYNEEAYNGAYLLENEETDFSNYERFDQDFDSDNPDD